MSSQSLFQWSPMARVALLGLALSGSVAQAQSRQFQEAVQSVIEQKEVPQSHSKSYSDAAGAHANLRRTNTVVKSSNTPDSAVRGK